MCPSKRDQRHFFKCSFSLWSQDCLSDALRLRGVVRAIVLACWPCRQRAVVHPLGSSALTLKLTDEELPKPVQPVRMPWVIREVHRFGRVLCEVKELLGGGLRLEDVPAEWNTLRG